MVKLLRCSLPVAVCAGLFFAPICLAVDESRLWLPKKYQKNYVALLKAAAAAESVERCVNVLDATIDLDQSQDEHPIFRILCRQESGRSYNEMVDGLSFEALTTPKPLLVELSAEELEQLRLQQEAIELERVGALKASLWQACQLELEGETSLMNDLTWLSEGDSEPLSFIEMDRQLSASSEGVDESAAESLIEGMLAEAVFAIDFDARTLAGEKLRYRALCTVANQGKPTIEIKKRQ